MLDPSVLSFVLESLPPAPARVLEVGAGDGELARALGFAGHEVVAIDPEPGAAWVRRVTLLELQEPPGSFDAAVAVVSLHHVEPLADSCRRLARVLRPGASLVVDEFDVALFDERAAAWWLACRQPGEHDARAPEDVVADLRHHCHSLSHLRETLGEWFELTEPARGPYLYRWLLSPEMREAEEALIAAGRLQATGARLTGVRE